MLSKYILVTVILILLHGEHTHTVTVYNPYFQFPGGSDPFMGIIVAIAIPVEASTPGEILLTSIIEGNYVVPTNETEFEYPPILGESSERTFFYEALKRKIEDLGYSGKKCLLRIICEVAEISSINTGVLGDILHILLSPSTSKKEDKLMEYEEAEILGKSGKCNQYKKQCPYNILNAISRIKLISDSF